MAGLDRIMSRIAAMGVRDTERFWSLMPADLAKRCRAQTARIADSFATFMPTSDALRMNRVIGLGHRRRVEACTIDDLVERYRAAKVKRFCVMAGPGLHAAALRRLLVARGFVRQHGLALLLRDGHVPVARVATTLRVVRESHAMHRAALEILQESFPMPASRIAWSVAARLSDGDENFVALDGARPVAAASLRVDGDLAWLGGAATRTRWRRRGAQGALIATRLRRAVQLGCRWAWCETAEPAHRRPDISRRNLLRHGFVQVGVTPRYVWQER